MKKTSKSLILVVGMPGSGKTAASEAARGLGFRVFSFGDIIRDEIRRRGLKGSEENAERVSNWFNAGREHILAKRLERILRPIKTSKPFIVIEGARSPKQITELRNNFSVRILAITSSKGMRWSRQMKRHRSDIRNLADAKARDARELGYGIGALMRQADWRVSSAGSLDKFRKRSRRFFKNLLKAARQGKSAQTI